MLCPHAVCAVGLQAELAVKGSPGRQHLLLLALLQAETESLDGKSLICLLASALDAELQGKDLLLLRRLRLARSRGKRWGGECDQACCWTGGCWLL